MRARGSRRSWNAARARFARTAAALTVATMVAAGLTAVSATPAAGDGHVTVVASGLDQPRGLTIAVNGSLNRADLYVDGALFRKLWPKLLEGAAVEAVARRPQWDRTWRAKVPTLEAVKSYLEGSRVGHTSTQQVTGDVVATTTLRGNTTFYETRILKPKDTWVHHGYVTGTTRAAG